MKTTQLCKMRAHHFTRSFWAHAQKNHQRSFWRRRPITRHLCHPQKYRHFFSNVALKESGITILELTKIWGHI